MGLKVFIDKVKNIFKKETKIVENNTYNEQTVIVKEVNPIAKKVNDLKNHGIICDDKPIYGIFPMIKLLSFNKKYFDSLTDNNYLGIYEYYSYKEIMNPDKFSNYISSEDITYDDIINTIRENNNIQNNEKNILIDGIKKLKKKNINIDLRILNYNLKRIKFENKILEVGTIAQYVTEEAKVYIDTNKIKNNEKAYYKRILIHEVLGHASNISYINDNGGILGTTHMMCMNITSKDSFSYNIYCQSFDEAIAEYITVNAIDKKYESSTSNYLPYLYELLILCKSVNITIEDYIKYGIEYLINKLNENNLKEGIDLIQLFELKFDSLIYFNCDYNSEVTIDMIITNFLSKVAQNNYSNNISLNDNLNHLNEIINVYKKYIITYKQNNKEFILSGSCEQNIQEIDFNNIRNEINLIVNDIYSKKKVLN